MLWMVLPLHRKLPPHSLQLLLLCVEAPASAARPEATAPKGGQVAEAPEGPQVAAESSAPATHSSPVLLRHCPMRPSRWRKMQSRRPAEEPASGLSPDSAPWAPVPAEFGRAPEPAPSVPECKLVPRSLGARPGTCPAFTKPAQAPASPRALHGMTTRCPTTTLPPWTTTTYPRSICPVRILMPPHHRLPLLRPALLQPLR